MKYRKRPVVVDAVRWDPSETGVPKRSWPAAFLPDAKRWLVSAIDLSLHIPTLEGTMRAAVGDWIIRGVNGEFYPCKPDIFEKTYEKAEKVGPE